MTHNRAPLALPALIAGIVGLLLVLFLGAGLGALLGVGAMVMGGIAYTDTRSHGFDGAEMALVGAALGLLALVLMIVTVAVL